MPEQRRALKDLTACRTAALGGHILGCPECGHQQIAYNSCGNRHCPTCRTTAAARWLEAQAADLLPVAYFHLVFTLPNVLDPLALANPRVVYDLLYGLPPRPYSRWQPIRTGWVPAPAYWPCSTPGARPCSSTRTSTVSCRVAGCRRMGRVGLAHGRITSCRSQSSAAFSAVSSWRGCARRMPPGGSASRAGPLIRRPSMLASSSWCRLPCTDWVVHAKRPFGSPDVVLKYLGALYPPGGDQQ